MKEIPLTKGLVALIDDQDFELVNQFRWRALASRYKGKVLTYYAQRNVIRGKTTQFMHQLIFPGVPTIDHKDHDGLNNQRYNLRPCTGSQNLGNRRSVPNRSGYKGVAPTPNGKWWARIGHQRKYFHLGTFSRKEDAARAYDKKAVELYGEFAFLNFPKEQQ